MLFTGVGSSAFNLAFLSLGPSSQITFAQEIVNMTADEMTMMQASVIDSDNVIGQKSIYIYSINLYMFDAASLDVSGGGNTSGDGACMFVFKYLFLVFYVNSKHDH